MMPSHLGSHFLDNEALRFVIAGSFNTIFCYIVFVCLLLTGLSSTLAMSVAAIVTTLIGFFIMSRFVFRCDLNIQRSLRFFTMQAVGYITNISILNLILLTGITAYQGGIASLAITATLTFFTSKYIVFHKKAEMPDNTHR